MNLIIITGQTATGKTKLALKLAKKYNGELINFDSRQIYKYLDIITGKDIPIPLSSSKIWLYDIVTPDKYFSSFDYVQKAEKIIQDIIQRGKKPILVGGTYFYLKHLLYGFDKKIPPNFKLREILNKKSVEELQKILKKLDRQSINQMNNSDKNNPRRLIRKIEIETDSVSNSFPPVLLTSALSGTLSSRHLFQKKIIGIRYKNKNKLIKAIKIRVLKRLKNGAIEEVENLLKMGYKETDPGMKTIGYQEIIQYLKGEITKQQAIEQWTNHEIQYAKRQLTFMKQDKNIKWKEI